ncbi:MAG: hypothetical protein V2I56_19855 [Desulfobacteraceae bacterium]|nr:hypothetical protein [Desulfobacteraceae bacterium]
MMLDKAIEIMLYSIMTVIYFIADKQHLVQPALVRRGLLSGRRRPAER